MKKTFLAMLLAGGTMSMFAQNTQTGTTGNQSGTTGTTGTTTQGTQSGTTGQTGTTTQGTTGTTNNSSMGTSNSGTMNNGTMSGTTNNGSMSSGNTGTWNGVSSNPSTSWAPERDPSWSWNNYGVWNSSANWNSNSNATSVYGSNNMNNGTANSGTMNNGTTNADGTMSSTGSYNAYSGVAVPSLPANVQMRFSQDFPTGVNNQYAWHQYGDWFHTHHMSNGRLIQYFYDQRGAGYALALPVLQSYVPENIVASALNKYGSSLYSISTVKTQDGKDVYQIGLLQRGQMNMQYLDESGVSLANIWRVDSLDNSGALNSMQSNAAMGTDASMSSGSMNTQSNMSGDKVKTKEGKIEIEHADGSETKIKWEKDKTKIKTKNGKSKVKTDASNSNDQNNLNQNQ